MDEGWVNLGKSLIESLLYLGVTVLTTFAIIYIRKYANVLVDKINNEDAEKYIRLAEQTIIDVVMATNQTFVDIRKAEGTFDQDAWTIAFEKTKGNILAILTETQKKAIEEVYGDLDKWLETKIEATVLEVKNNKPAGNVKAA